MNATHLWAVLQLRWRLGSRRWGRDSPTANVFSVLWTVVAVGSAFATLGLSLGLGTYFLPGTPPVIVLLVWDAVIVTFLIWSLMSVVLDLQSTEGLLMDRMLHLPVSLPGVFLLDYAASLGKVSNLVGAGAFVGLSLASVAVYGKVGIVLLSASLAMLVAVTALTHWFHHWLATGVAGKVGRSTVAALTLAIFVAAVNVPNAFLHANLPGAPDAPDVAAEELAELERLAIGISLALPPGWLAYGASELSRGRHWPSVLSALGLTGVAAFALRRAYRSTLGLYRSRDRRDGGSRAVRRRRRRRADVWFGGDAPWCHLWRRVPEHAAATAEAGVRMWYRTPQGKMLLLTGPLLFFVVYLFAFLPHNPPVLSGGPIGSLGLVGLLSVGWCSAFLPNQFGLDGCGFRISLLVHAQGSSLLFGKNLSVAPYPLAIASLTLAGLQFLAPMELSHLLASFFQVANLYLLCCMAGNSLSIVMPVPISPNTMETGRRSTSSVVLLVMLTVITLAIGAAALALHLEGRLQAIGWRMPVYLAFSVIELVVVSSIYRRLLAIQGRLLECRASFVLERVTATAR